MLATSIETLPGGRRIRMARLGDTPGAPSLLCLHGYPENLQIFCELLPRLARRFDAIAVDWPGLGESDPWPGGATPAHLAERIKTLLDAWGIERVTLVATDMGGQPALAFAARHPDRIDALVVMNSLVFGDEATSWDIRLMREYGLNRIFLRSFPGTVFRRANESFLPPGVALPPELHADLWRGFSRAEARAFIIKMCAGYQGTLAALPALYGEIGCPTFILWAEQDKHFPPVQARRLHEAIPGSTLEIVPGARHWMIWYHAEEIAARILAFTAGER